MKWILAIAVYLSAGGLFYSLAYYLIDRTGSAEDYPPWSWLTMVVGMFTWPIALIQAYRNQPEKDLK